MTTVGQIEKKTQQRVVKLFRDQLGYDYLGDWSDRENTRNVESDYLRAFLKKQGHDDTLISLPSTKPPVTRAKLSTIATRKSMNCCAMG